MRTDPATGRRTPCVSILASAELPSPSAPVRVLALLNSGIRGIATGCDRVLVGTDDSGLHCVDAGVPPPRPKQRWWQLWRTAMPPPAAIAEVRKGRANGAAVEQRAFAPALLPVRLAAAAETAAAAATAPATVSKGKGKGAAAAKEAAASTGESTSGAACCMHAKGGRFQASMVLMADGYAEEVSQFTTSPPGSTGEYRVSALGRLKLADGSGPCALVAHPTAAIAYVLCAVEGTVAVLELSPHAPPALLGAVSVIADGAPPRRLSDGAAAVGGAICMSSDGRHIYAVPDFDGS